MTPVEVAALKQAIASGNLTDEQRGRLSPTLLSKLKEEKPDV